MAHKILVVDDDYSFAEFAGMLLETFGYTAAIFLSAARIVEVAISEKPDLIIMDINMPDVNGLEAVKNLKADPATAAIPVLMCSITTAEAGALSALEAGALGFIRKPLKKDELKKRLDEIFLKRG